MKTNFKSSLFDKKIELNSFDSIQGGGTGCKITTYDKQSDGSTMVTTDVYDENSNLVSSDVCYLGLAGIE